MARFVSAMVALAALLLVAVHPAAMATASVAPKAPANVAPKAPVAAAAPCHEAAVKAVKAVKDDGAKTKRVADCCDDGRCGGNCTPAGAFFRDLPVKLLAFLRAALQAPVTAQAPFVIADARERPPKIGA